MRERIVHVKRKCDDCQQVKDVVYDGPFYLGGSWGNKCSDCITDVEIKHFDAVGIKLVYKPEPVKQDRVVNGKELSEPEDVIFDSIREIGCPECEAVHSVEPDADYTYTCEGCGVKVQVPMPIF